ncbi:MAG: tryptophan 7-halogenase, partial [Porticoccaceae bacterium]|nr:tryptophan 7-halogenase [Porticoccaceae bacterium]
AARVPIDGDSYQPRPYTTSTAQESGWIWDIDLYRRRGTGYVYSSEHSSEERAETVLRNYLGEAGTNAQVRHLKMRVGRLRKIWHRNCVAVGLSAGFIEPLESTGILFIDLGLRFLGELFPSQFPSDEQQDRYNKVMGDLLDNTRDFILLHYLLTQREDSSFWKAYRHDIQATDRLKQKLELWKSKVPSIIDFSDDISTFAAPSHSFIMYGMGWQHEAAPGSVAHLNQEFGKQVMSAMADHQKDVLQKAPDHLTVLKALRERSSIALN